MKKIGFSCFFLCLSSFILFFIITGQRKRTDIITFPKTTWRMSPNEVLNAYGLSKEEVDYEENEDVVYISTLKFKLFDITTEGVSFEFWKDKRGDSKII